MTKLKIKNLPMKMTHNYCRLLCFKYIIKNDFYANFLRSCAVRR